MRGTSFLAGFFIISTCTKHESADRNEMDVKVPNAGDCNFDSSNWKSLCGRSQRLDDDADWMQANYRQNPKTGADADHQGTQNGQFLTINSGSMRPGDVADIQSQFFPRSTGVCYVRFNYYMYGSDNIGPLRLYTYNTNSQKNLMWSISGNKGQSWQYANVLVGDNANFSVIIEATAGTKAKSDIAIDDVTFTPECKTGLPPVKLNRPKCNAQTEIYCKPRQECLPKAWQCDGIWDCPDGSDEGSQCPTTTAKSLPSGVTRPSRPSTTKGSTTLRTVPPKTSVITPRVNNCPHGQFQCGSSQCIPAILHCDGVPDCADQTDEGSDCKKCRVDFYYCTKQRKCITNATRCDDKDDCGDGTDESLCTPACGDPNFSCQNGGTCIIGSSPPMCSCTTGNQGTRCQFKSPNSSPSQQKNSSGGWKIGVGVTFGIVGLIVIAVGAFFMLKKYKPDVNLPSLSSFRRGRTPEGGLTNPVYDGYGSESQTDFQMSDIDNGMRSTSIENPLYSDA